jgi:hypothetical protein
MTSSTGSGCRTWRQAAPADGRDRRPSMWSCSAPISLVGSACWLLRAPLRHPARYEEGASRSHVMVNSAGRAASVQSGKGSGGRGPERVAAAPTPGDVRMEVVEGGHLSHGLDMDTVVELGTRQLGESRRRACRRRGGVTWVFLQRMYVGFPHSEQCRLRGPLGDPYRA